MKPLKCQSASFLFPHFIFYSLRLWNPSLSCFLSTRLPLTYFLISSLFTSSCLSFFSLLNLTSLLPLPSLDFVFTSFLLWITYFPFPPPFLTSLTWPPDLLPYFFTSLSLPLCFLPYFPTSSTLPHLTSLLPQLWPCSFLSSFLTSFLLCIPYLPSLFTYRTSPPSFRFYHNFINSLIYLLTSLVSYLRNFFVPPSLLKFYWLPSLFPPHLPHFFPCFWPYPLSSLRHSLFLKSVCASFIPYFFPYFLTLKHHVAYLHLLSLTSFLISIITSYIPDVSFLYPSLLFFLPSLPYLTYLLLSILYSSLTSLPYWTHLFSSIFLSFSTWFLISLLQLLGKPQEF